MLVQQAPVVIDTWDHYLDSGFPFADYPAGACVLDLGFGGGRQLRALVARGCRAVGLEADSRLVALASACGLSVSHGQAERLPFASASFDGVVCEVVIPYTDEARAIAEIGRVLKPGGLARLSYHGLGYPLRSLAIERGWKRQLYSARVMVNTWVYALSGRRLPGFWGDTVYQSRARLRRHYEQAGLELVEERVPARFAGAPVFLYHAVRRRA